jgi:hypothetical protein
VTSKIEFSNSRNQSAAKWLQNKKMRLKISFKVINKNEYTIEISFKALWLLCSTLNSRFGELEDWRIRYLMSRTGN